MLEGVFWASNPFPYLMEVVLGLMQATGKLPYEIQTQTGKHYVGILYIIGSLLIRLNVVHNSVLIHSLYHAVLHCTLYYIILHCASL